MPYSRPRIRRSQQIDKVSSIKEEGDFQRNGSGWKKGSHNAWLIVAQQSQQLNYDFFFFFLLSSPQEASRAADRLASGSFLAPLNCLCNRFLTASSFISLKVSRFLLLSFPLNVLFPKVRLSFGLLNSFICFEYCPSVIAWLALFFMCSFVAAFTVLSNLLPLSFW